jgi:hypothetical protein
MALGSGREAVVLGSAGLGWDWEVQVWEKKG